MWPEEAPALEGSRTRQGVSPAPQNLSCWSRGAASTGFQPEPATWEIAHTLEGIVHYSSSKEEPVQRTEWHPACGTHTWWKSLSSSLSASSGLRYSTMRTLYSLLMIPPSTSNNKPICVWITHQNAWNGGLEFQWPHGLSVRLKDITSKTKVLVINFRQSQSWNSSVSSRQGGFPLDL